MSKIAKRVTVLSIGIVLLTLMLVGASAQGKVTLRLWHGLGNVDGPYFHKLIEEFNQTHPEIDIKPRTWGDWGQFYDKLAISIKVGTASDIVTFHTSNIPRFAAIGAFYPITQEIAEMGLKGEDFFQPTWQGTFYEGEQYAAPLDFHPQSMYYNVKHFREAGLDPANPPYTLEEYIVAGKKLTQDRDGDGKTDQWGYVFNMDTWAVQFWSTIPQYGGQVIDEDMWKCLLDSKESIQALQVWVDMVEKYGISPAKCTEDMQLFITQRASMKSDGTWILLGLKEQEPELEWDNTVFPKFGANPAVWVDSHAFGLPVQKKRDAEKIDAALQFIEWMVTHPLRWVRAGHVPASREAAFSEEFRTECPNQYNASLQYAALTYLPRTVHLREIWSRLGTAFQSATLGQLTAEEALKKATAEIDKFLDGR